MNFSYREIIGDSKNMPPLSKPFLAFTLAIQEFREWYRKSMKVNCWYRDEVYNLKVHGDENSNHLIGCAIDWSIRGIVDNMDDERLEAFRIHIVNKWIELGIKYGYEVQVELCPTYIHLAFGWNSNRYNSRIGLAKGAENRTIEINGVKHKTKTFKQYYGQTNMPSILSNKGGVKY